MHVSFDSFYLLCKRIRVWLRHPASISYLCASTAFTPFCTVCHCYVMSMRCTCECCTVFVCCACCCVRLRSFALFRLSLLCGVDSISNSHNYASFSRFRSTSSRVLVVTVHFASSSSSRRCSDYIYVWENDYDRNDNTHAPHRALGLLLRFDHAFVTSCCPLT